MRIDEAATVDTPAPAQTRGSANRSDEVDDDDGAAEESEVDGAEASEPLPRLFSESLLDGRGMTMDRSASERSPGEKRSPTELVRLTEKLGAYIRAHPGMGVEAISRALGVSTRELALPTKRLMAENRVRTRGQKRATKYYPV